MQTSVQHSQITKRCYTFAIGPPSIASTTAWELQILKAMGLQTAYTARAYSQAEAVGIFSPSAHLCIGGITVSESAERPPYWTYTAT